MRTVLASPDVDEFLVADDDDIYLPHWFRPTADALAQAEWSRPGLVLLEDGDGLREIESAGLYHGGWAYRKVAFCRVRGYGPQNYGEDQELAGQLHETGVTDQDPCEYHEPFSSYRYDKSSYHLSYMDDAGYRSLGNGSVTKTQVQSGWWRDYASLAVRRRFPKGVRRFVDAGVRPNSGLMKLDLAGIGSRQVEKYILAQPLALQRWEAGSFGEPANAESGATAGGRCRRRRHRPLSRWGVCQPLKDTMPRNPKQFGKCGRAVFAKPRKDKLDRKSGALGEESSSTCIGGWACLRGQLPRCNDSDLTTTQEVVIARQCFEPAFYALGDW